MTDNDVKQIERVGLCANCKHSRVIKSAKGSEFWMCQRAQQGATRFPKYPRLPVHSCLGFERAKS